MKFLILQTAFIGDVILATPLIEKLHQIYPESQIDFLLRKGNESLLEGHPYINKVIIWDKNNNKYRNLFSVIRQIRKNKYDYAINVQRFLSTGIITAFSNAKYKIGFNKNPLSFLFNYKVEHIIGDNIHHVHEIDRNLSLLNYIITHEGIVAGESDKLTTDFTKHYALSTKHYPRLYPSENDYATIKNLHSESSDYICIAPSSVWFTKQYPEEKWTDFINQLKTQPSLIIYLLGSKTDFDLCQRLITESYKSEKSSINIFNLARQTFTSANCSFDAKCKNELCE